MSSTFVTGSPFPPTRWTLIVDAKDGGDGERKKALEELCVIYWRPVFTFIRSKGATREEAEDLTQGFFADFLKRDSFSKAKVERGKLRTFILSGIGNFMTSDWRSRNRQKRGGGAQHFSLDLTRDDADAGILEPADSVTPETLFERQWALTVLGQVLDQLRVRYEKKGQAELFDCLKNVVTSEKIDASYADIAKELSMKENTVKVAAHRLKKRYGNLLRETIADTLIEGEDTEEELRYLMSVFS